MKVYIVMLYYSEEYHVGNVYSHKEDAQIEVDRDLMKFDYVVEREVNDIPVN